MVKKKLDNKPDDKIAPAAARGGAFRTVWGYYRLRTTLVLAVLSLLCASLLGNVFLVYKYKTKKTSQIATVSLHYADEQPCVGESRGTVRILFLGNSITLHPLCSYWWGEWGMAASTKEKDYVHRLVDMEAEDYDVEYTAVNFGAWETQSHDRAETLDFIASFLQEQYDYVVIQLGENISDYSTLETDLEEFVSCVDDSQAADGMPADILIVGGFWEANEIDAIKESVCEGLQDSPDGIQFVDLSVLWSDTVYQSSIGNTVMGDDGKAHTIEHDGVARHPGDEGMEAIAGRIYEAMQEMQ